MNAVPGYSRPKPTVYATTLSTPATIVLPGGFFFCVAIPARCRSWCSDQQFQGHLIQSLTPGFCDRLVHRHTRSCRPSDTECRTSDRSRIIRLAACLIRLILNRSESFWYGEILATDSWVSIADTGRNDSQTMRR
jgi:hypothetical protein